MKLTRYILLLAIFGITLSACDTFQPSKLCGDETEADHQAFVQIFAEMQLVNLDGSYVEEGTENAGRVFETPTSLSLTLNTSQDTNLRLCIFGAKRNREIVFDETFNVSTGAESILLGDFTKGSYIIRVYADDLLVENISFMIRE